MPSRNIVKIYAKDSFYHVYNRGVAKQDIFKDRQDYRVFLNYLKEALSKQKKVKIDFSLRGRTFKAVKKSVKNFYNEINLLAYCLMPNHFHLLIKQADLNSMTSFIRSLITRYAKYFNKKYDRVGPLFQGKYKAVIITDDRYLLHLSRYIHQNPQEITTDLLAGYSSYAEYLGLRKTQWVKPDIILSFFNNRVIPEIIKINNYKSFTEESSLDLIDKADILGELTLE